jgi:hypothetical protein
VQVNLNPSLGDIALLVIAVFVILAYFNGWG